MGHGIIAWIIIGIVAGWLTGKIMKGSGFADDAFFVSSAGNSAALYALKNKHLLLITVDDPSFTKAQNESAELTLATAILPKL